MILEYFVHLNGFQSKESANLNIQHEFQFEIDFMLKTLNHITIFESGKLVFTFMDGRK
jgi:hypothetical protein